MFYGTFSIKAMGSGATIIKQTTATTQHGSNKIATVVTWDGTNFTKSEEKGY